MSGEDPQVEETGRPRREPTSWTRPMQRAAAAYLVVGVAWTLLTTVLFVNVATVERMTRVTNPSVPPDQVEASASFSVGLGWAVTVAVSVLMLVLALGSVRGWRWTFWAVLVWLALTSVGVITNSVALASPTSVVEPPAAIVVGLLLSAAGLALLVWFIVAAARYGPWAVRRAAA
jgi:hypothetical protein